MRLQLFNGSSRPAGTLRLTIAALVLLAGPAPAGNLPAAPSGETTVRTPEMRRVPLARTLRFEPQADITAAELEQLGPYLKGKPLHESDQEALGAARRHFREVK